MNQKILIGLIAVIIFAVGAGAFVSSNSAKNNDLAMQQEKTETVAMPKTETEVMQKTESETMQKEEVAADAMMQKDETRMVENSMEKSDTMMKAGSYEAYSAEKIARAETGNVVLFFHASWCPTCRSLSSDIEKNSSSIPADLSLLKVDYDTESELKKKYGVTYQHTLVQVDKDGKLIKKWNGSSSLAALVSEIK